MPGREAVVAPELAEGEEDGEELASLSTGGEVPAATTDGVALLAQPVIHRAELKARTAPRCVQDVFLPFGCMVSRATART